MSNQLDNELRELISKMPNINMSGKMAFRELLWQQYDNGNLTQADVVWMQALVGLFTDAFQSYEELLITREFHRMEMPKFVEDYVNTGD